MVGFYFYLSGMKNLIKRLFKITLLIGQFFSNMFYNVLRYVYIALVKGGLLNFSSRWLENKVNEQNDKRYRVQSELSEKDCYLAANLTGILISPFLILLLDKTLQRLLLILTLSPSCIPVALSPSFLNSN